MVEQRAFSPQEVARMLGISRRQVHKLIRRGDLKSKKLGRNRRIFLNHLEEFLGEEEAYSLVKSFNTEEGDSEER